MNYLEFLQSKIDIAEETGFEIDPGEVNPALLPHQRDAVVWALRGGRRALFESFGLGKTVQQLEWARIICEKQGCRVLIILPLGVKQEFRLDAVRLLGWKEAPPYVRTDAEAMLTDARILLTNYERVRDGDINPRRFGAVSLDEASCLRSFGSKTYQQFLTILKGIPYKLVCTATPSPNRYKELIHYAGYLEIMDTGQALTRFFQRDSTKANNLTLYPHREHDFWLWMSSWALAKKMDAEGRLPATFMVVAPGSWTDSVWDDINRMRTYNTTQSQRRKQMHVCPLQIDIVDRLIDRYTNPGDTILDPFGGIMTVPTEAVKKGRRGIGVELNADYFRDGVGYLQSADIQRGMPTLFDFLDVTS